MPIGQWMEIQREFSAVYNGQRTNIQVPGFIHSHESLSPVQIIVVPEVRRMIGREPSKPCSEMEGTEFAKHVLENFDLDIVRHAIYANDYISGWGGLDTILTFIDEEYLQFMDLNVLVWPDRSSCSRIPYSTTTVCDCSWRPMTQTEKHLKRMETKARVAKYVSRYFTCAIRAC